jgi:hypothetical protein
MMTKFIHKLDKNNFFFEAVTTLAYTQFGINELFARGFLLQKHHEFPINDDFRKHMRTLGFPMEVEKQIFESTSFTPMIFVPGFTTKDKARTYQMEPNESSKQFVNQTGGLTKTNLILTYMTIVSAWEKILPLNLTDSDVYQFFRHIRNAAAHNGKFQFDKKVIHQRSGELKKSAKWRTFEIKSSLQGVSLIVEDKNDQNNFWDQGDLVEFLLDFENHYPSVNSADIDQ